MKRHKSKNTLRIEFNSFIKNTEISPSDSAVDLAEVDKYIVKTGENTNENKPMDRS